MGKIHAFVSNRREDSRHQSDRICDHLVPQFGKDCVFQDVDNQIPQGATSGMSSANGLASATSSGL